MTAVHPTAFKQQVAKKKEEEFAKQKSTRYATLAGGLMSTQFAVRRKCIVL
jgi:hypothetical protein